MHQIRGVFIVPVLSTLDVLLVECEKAIVVQEQIGNSDVATESRHVALLMRADESVSLGMSKA